jgi:hypothetical protein
MTSIEGHCTTCGVPLTGVSCAVCGGNAEQLTLADGDGNLPRFGAEAGKPELEWAHEAWARGEHARVVSHCLAAAGAQGIKNIALPEGPAFVAVVGGMSIILRVRPQREHLVIETPVARLPMTQYVGAMRLALELSGGTRSAARYAVRGDTLVLRMTGRLDTMTPHVIQAAIDSLVAQASDDARVMSTSVHARVLTTEEHVDMDLDKLPETPALDLEQSGGAPSTGKTAPPPTGGAKPTGTSGMFQSVAPILTPSGPAPAPVKIPPPPPPAPTSQAATKPGPPRLAPPPPSAAKPPPVTVRSPEDGIPAELAASVVDAKADKNLIGNPTPIVGAMRVPDAKPAGAPGPADGLVDLLHKAQTLGAVLSFADLPASMMLLIRAAVYRAVFDYESAAPAAVAHLFNETAAMTREIYITAPGKRRGAMAIPSAQPAFDVMQVIVDKRGDVPVSNPIQVTPITTSQEAKQHLARYLSEIDQAPQDLELRHFLALGALSELLVRTKLPAATMDRLKGIVALAEREGAKQQNVDLMMTALSRMIA